MIDYYKLKKINYKETDYEECNARNGKVNCRSHQN